MIGAHHCAERNGIKEPWLGHHRPRGEGIRQLMRQPEFLAIRSGFLERREAERVSGFDVEERAPLRTSETVAVDLGLKDLELRRVLGDDLRECSVGGEPGLRRSVQAIDIPCPSHARYRRRGIKNGDAVLAANSHPDFLDVAAEGRFVQLATDEHAAGETFGIRLSAGLRIGHVPDHLHGLEINQIDVARAAPGAGQQLIVRRRRRAVNMDGAMVQRLRHHRGMRECGPSSLIIAVTGRAPLSLTSSPVIGRPRPTSAGKPAYFAPPVRAMSHGRSRAGGGRARSERQSATSDGLARAGNWLGKPTGRRSEGMQTGAERIARARPARGMGSTARTWG